MILNGEGRFILLDGPAAFPFKDIVTGTPEGPVFDLSVDLDGFDGVGYVKAEHVIEMAHVLGMSTKEETEKMRARISQLESDNSKVPENVERLINGIDNLVAEFNSGIVTRDAGLELLGLSADSETSDSDNRQGTSIPSGSSIEPDGIDADKQADGIDSTAVKVGKPSIDKGPAKLSAGSNDGFGFDN